MKVWIVGQASDDTRGWMFQGVFSTQEAAVAACLSDECFIGPAIMDGPLPLERTSWGGAYYPRLEEDPGAQPDVRL